ncbi:MAG: polysaccharide deacetylase family protein [Anaerolineae bacterium]
MNPRLRLLSAALSFGLLAAGCGPAPAAPTLPASATPDPPTATPQPTATLTPSITSTPSPVPTATPTWVAQGPDAVKVPILLYHHIAVSPVNSRYYVPPDTFEAELKLLHDWGYSTITTSMLVQAIQKGTSLPPRPMLITFDDGNEDNYTNAFPIMQKYGFTGVLYIVVQYMNLPNYMTVDQIKEMAAAGWEVGSHSETHRNLVGDEDVLRYEIVQSRKDLEDRLDLPVLTFAYPFGVENGAAADYAHFADYIAAMGATGYTADQGKGNLFVLQRCEIKGSDDAKTFTRFLPWLGDPEFLPTDTPSATPTASRTPVPTHTP